MKIESKYPGYRTMSGIGFAAVVIGGCANIPAPTEQIAVSKLAVTSATSAGGNEFAPADMRTAQEKLDRAVQAMTTEDFRNAKTLAEQAQVDAQVAEAKARAAKAQQAAATVQEDSRVLSKELDRKSP